MTTVVSNIAKLSPRNPKDAFGRAYGEQSPEKRRKGKPVILKSVKPDHALELEYRKILREWIEEMHNSILYWVRAAYKQNEPEIAADASLMTIFEQAEQFDKRGYGTANIKLHPDEDKWHSYYDFDDDSVNIEEKFWKEEDAEQVHMLLHEFGHRGQKVDPDTWQAFKKSNLDHRPEFEAMANPVHLKDEREGHLHNMGEEIFAESYSRWCLGMPMPNDLFLFWETRPPIPAQDMAMDAVPARKLQKAIKKLTKRWQRNFDEAAPKLAAWFTLKASKRSDKKLMKILRQGGFSVKFKMTKVQRDILAATINQNVALIKSIPQQHLKEVEGLVMRSVQTGRDLNTLTKDLLKRYKITYKRAALIARDQNNKATSALNRARQIDLGITEGIWMHSHAGKTPRPSHVAMHGKKYNLKKGMWDKDEKKWIHPGELINCRCTMRPVVEGFD